MKKVRSGTLRSDRALTSVTLAEWGAFAIALAAGHELYLLLALLIVPAGFVLTAAAIAFQALRKHGRLGRP